MDEDSYTKEQTKSAKFVSLVHAVSIASPAAKAAAAAAQHALAPTRLTSAASVSTLEEDMEGEPEPPPPQVARWMRCSVMRASATLSTLAKLPAPSA